MRPPVRVLWLTKGLGRGGTEMLLLSLAKAIDPAVVQLDVAYVLPHKDALLPALRAAGTTVHCLGGKGRPGEWAVRLRRLLVEEQYDVVHTHAPVAGAAARVLAPSQSVLLHTEHNVWDRYRRPTRWANAVTINRNEIVWGVSEGVARSIHPWPIGQHRARVAVMLHGIDPTQVRKGPEARAAGLERLGLVGGPLTVGTVGNLTPKKDHDSMLRALARLRQYVPDARLVIIGTGPREQHLRAVAQDVGVADAVLFIGIRDDVPELLPAFDVFAMSSLHEGLSIALVEALAAGLPVVATRVGGIPELVVDGESGVLVPPSDPRRLADAIVGIATDAALRRRLTEAAPLRAAKFGIQPAADTLTEQYLSLTQTSTTAEVTA